MIPMLVPKRRRSLCAAPAPLLTVLLTVLLAAPAQAQSPGAARPDPLNPKAQVPALRYESAFAQFRRVGGDQPLAWREANDAVARIGGWRTYAREAQQPDAAATPVPGPVPATAPASAPAAVARPAPPAHGGHKH